MKQEDSTADLRVVNYGSRRIEYRLRVSRRKTLEIAVNPDRSVQVTAPPSADISAIESVLKKRSRWIMNQLRFFEEFNPRTPRRHYISGETHRYQGKPYRLVITIGDRAQVTRTRNELIVTVTGSSEPARVKRVLERWYRIQAYEEFHNAVNRCWQNIPGIPEPRPRVIVKRMEKRWGSLSANRILTLNILLIQASRECIDYVITHELCHLKHPDHGPAFYALLERSFPDWNKAKRHLEKSMA